MDKRELSERDICSKFITPAVTAAGWDSLLQIREEVGFTKGQVPGADDFFGRMAPENWPCTSRMLPLSVRIPVVTGVATDSSHPETGLAS